MGLLVLALEILFLLVLGAVVMSWLPPGGELLESVRRFFHLSTEWLLGPLRRSIPPLRLGTAALDLSPLIVLIGIQVLIAVLA
jgi:YggT family protein